MIKTLTLMLTVYNPAIDEESEIVYATYAYEECFINEIEINKIDSRLNKTLNDYKLELIETSCQ